jgi:IS30 family transposase
VPGARLSFRERVEICRGLAGEGSFAEIGRALGRPTSTVAREVARNGGRRRYGAETAQRRCEHKARRPKAFKLERHGQLRRAVASKLRLEWSPDQIAGWLRQQHPGDPRWWVSAQTIYDAIYVQGRGGLAAELKAHLRLEHNRRRRTLSKDGRGRLVGAINIAARPPEVDQRRVPGHWEGDLLLGAPAGRSHLATLVERQSRFLVLVKLPDSRSAPDINAALVKAARQLPKQLARSFTWDCGKEMAKHLDFTVATGITVYFCDPSSPWQRGTNENTNGLLRQYWPKGVTDFRALSQANLDAVARRLNERPRKTLGYRTPADVYRELVAMAG